MMLYMGLVINTLALAGIFHLVGQKIYLPLLRLLKKNNQDHPQGFWKLMPKIFLAQFLKLSLEPLRSKEVQDFELRERQLFFATNSLGLILGMGLSLLTLVLPGFFYWGEHLSKTAMNLQEFSWIYYLSTNYLFGSIIGFIFAGALRFLLPQTGCFFWLGLQGVLSGVMSLGLAWGLILGDLFSGFLKQAWSERKDQEFLIRNSISTTLIFVFLFLSPWLQNFAELVRIEASASENRVFQLLGIFCFWWILDLTLNMVFFHFRYQHLESIGTRKLGKFKN